MKEIQKKYKGDRQKQNEELMKFYRENNINPAASCLPLLAQLPVFLALFFVLKDFAKQPAAGRARPGCTSSPSSPSRRRRTGSGYLLLVIYVGSQVLSTCFMSATMDKMQRGIMHGPAARLHHVIAHFPAGLVLYWVTTNLWTVGQGSSRAGSCPETPAPRPRSEVADAAEGRPGGSATTARARRGRGRSRRAGRSEAPPRTRQAQERAAAAR